MAEAKEGLKHYFQFYNNERSVGSGSPCSSSAPISNTKTGLHGRHELERINKFEMIYKEEGKDKKQTS
jgi:hypothetical protein